MEKKSHNVDITVVSRQTAMVALPSASDSVLVTIKETAHKHSVVDKYKDGAESCMWSDGKNKLGGVDLCKMK